MLPVVPPGGGDSPYDSPSAFAGSPWLVSLELLARERPARASEDRWRRARLREVAARRLPGHAALPRTRGSRKAFARFMHRAGKPARELDATLERTGVGSRTTRSSARSKRAHGGKPWTDWPSELARAGAAARSSARDASSRSEFDYDEFVQFEFSRQWAALREHCQRARRAAARRRADVRRARRRRRVGAPGALPARRRRRAARGRRRPARLLQRRRPALGQPPLRLGRGCARPATRGGSRGCARRWSASTRCGSTTSSAFIATGRSRPAPTAREGRPIRRAPGRAFSRARSTARSAQLPFIAEDLGLVTAERRRAARPLRAARHAHAQFAFGDAIAREYQPHRYPRRRGRVHRHPRQRHARAAGSLGTSASPNATHARSSRPSARARFAYAGSDGARSALGHRAHGAGLRRRHRHLPASRSARPGHRSAHERARHRRTATGTFARCADELDASIADALAAVRELRAIPADIRRMAETSTERMPKALRRTPLTRSKRGRRVRRIPRGVARLVALA